MHTLKTVLSSAAFTAVAGAGLLFATAPASAYTTCNSDGDCWHTDSRVNFPGVTLTVHDDKWRDAHQSDSHYKWHEADNDHDWHKGYWANGEWHPGG
jgi:hypothetical protein